MKKLFLWMGLLFAPFSVAHAQAPDAVTIQLTMNEGLELQFPHFQEFADVQVVRGGATNQGDFLFLCSGRLMWKLNSTEFAAMMQQELDDEFSQQGGDDLLWRAVATALSAKLSRIGEFEMGDTVSFARFRVRIEQAGADWIVTDAKIRESDPNPLTIIHKDTR
ncbi:MAG: hypothetical protein QGG09_17355 [Pirellulaceae bacterium]|nr:hypothetical protein [Pirellulaceae bacterium]HJN09878.1 hypothetical protein [Pirellulaceae bacterium]